MSVFVDTSAFISLLVAEDQNHQRAAATWRDLVARDELLVTTNYVAVETCSILHKRFGSTALRKLVGGALSVVSVEFVDLETHTA